MPCVACGVGGEGWWGGHQLPAPRRAAAHPPLRSQENPHRWTYRATVDLEGRFLTHIIFRTAKPDELRGGAAEIVHFSMPFMQGDVKLHVVVKPSNVSAANLEKFLYKEIMVPAIKTLKAQRRELQIEPYVLLLDGNRPTLNALDEPEIHSRGGVRASVRAVRAGRVRAGRVRAVTCACERAPRNSQALCKSLVNLTLNVVNLTLKIT